MSIGINNSSRTQNYSPELDTEGDVFVEHLIGKLEAESTRVDDYDAREHNIDARWHMSQYLDVDERMDLQPDNYDQETMNRLSDQEALEMLEDETEKVPEGTEQYEHLEEALKHMEEYITWKNNSGHEKFGANNYRSAI